MITRLLVVVGLTATMALIGIAAAGGNRMDEPTANTATDADFAALNCEPHNDSGCLAQSLGTGFWEHLINFYLGEWNQDGPAADVKEPPSRRDPWPGTPSAPAVHRLALW